MLVSALLFWLYVKSRGVRGSLVVPLSAALTVLLLALFATKYPFDHHPIVKASYALHLAAPLCACVGLAGEWGAHHTRRARSGLLQQLQCGLPRLGLGAVIAAVAWLVALEVWGS